MISIHRSTLASAISEAIRDAEKREVAAGYTGPSGYRASLITLLEALKNGEYIDIIGSID